jgi:hypothetical protein
MKRTVYFESSDTVFHNNFLEVLEDCINESSYDNETKDQLVNILNHNFNITTLKESKRLHKQVVGKNFLPNYIESVSK